MSCAARARRLDETAEIIVLERGQHVSFANCGLPYYVGGEIAEAASLLVQTPERLRAALNLDVRTGHDIVGLCPEASEVVVRTGEGEQRIGYDSLVLAPGAVASTPAIEGLDSPRVMTLRSVEDALALREGVESGALCAVGVSSVWRLPRPLRGKGCGRRWSSSLARCCRRWTQSKPGSSRRN